MATADNPSTASKSPRAVFATAPAWLPVAIVLLVLAQVVSHDWVDFDDPGHVTENPLLTPVTVEHLAAFWRAPYFHLYIPASYTLLAAEAAASRWLAGDAADTPLRPWLFHATSLALHAANAWLVVRLLRRLGSPPWAAAAGAMVFAIHPLQVETVAWVSEQRTLLATGLSLIAIDTLLAWAAGSATLRSWRYLAATAAFTLALLAKPSAVVVPLMAVAVAWQGDRSQRKPLLVGLVPWFALAALDVAVTRFAQPPSLVVDVPSIPERLLVAGDALAFYATKLVAPWNLCVAYGRMPRFVIDLPHTPAVAAAAALALAAVFLLPRLAAWRLPTLLFVVALLPVLGFVPFVFQNQSTVADRYASLALLGPALGVTGLVAAVSRRPAWRGFLAVGTAITIAGLAALSRQQAATWRDTRTLAIQACRASPGLTVPWTLLSGWQLDHGEVEAAVATAERAATLAPGNAIAWLNLGAGLVRLHEFEAANAAFARAHAAGTTQTEAAAIFHNRGHFHYVAGRFEEAVANFRIAADLDPAAVASVTNLAAALRRLGRDAEAEQVLDRLPHDAGR